MNSSFLKTPVYIVDEEGVIMEQKIGSQGQTHKEEKTHQLIQSQPKTESVLGVTLPIRFGDFSFKLEILKLGDERIKTVWFKKQKST